jgi:phosphocarrier protein HPr
VPSQTVVLRNATGLHARPARVFAKAAGEFESDVTVAKTGGDPDAVNAKSVLSVLTLDCHQGDEIVITAEGTDADRALTRLVALVDDGLGE